MAQEADFTLGRLQVSPSRGLVSDGTTEQRVTPQVMQALLALLRAEGRTVTRDELVDACWDGRIVSDDAINRVIALLRGLARQFDPPPFQLHTIPKIGFRLQVDEGPPASEPPTQTDAAAAVPAERNPVDPGRRRWAFALVILLLLAVVAAGLAWTAWRTPRSGPGAASFARVEVAPFQSLRAGDPDLARLAQATRGALMRVLGGADIPVVEAPAPGVGAAPDADFHLRGAVDRDGDATVINVQVLDRQRRNVIWSGRLERPLSAPARFPDQAANRIGDILHCALRSRAMSNRPITDAVLSLMMQVCELRRVGPEEAPQFLAAAERLRAAAPQLSRAQSLYATAAAAKGALSPEAPEAPGLVVAARAAAHRALQLDPSNEEAYFALGISYGFDQSWAEREANFLRAEGLSQGLSVMGDVHVGLLREVGRLREARELNRRTVADDPFGPDQLSTLVILTAAADGREAAEPLLQRIRLVATPEDADGVRLNATFWWDTPAAARALLTRMTGGAAPVDKPCFEAYLAGLAGPPRRGLPDACRTLQTDWRIRMLAREGDLDGAYREIAHARRGSQFLISLYYPEMRAFRADPRFMPLVARYGLVDYWRRSGHWPDFCTERDRPYDCAAVARELGSSAHPASP